MNASLTHTQNTNTEQIDMNLPSLTLNMDRIYPFAPKFGAKIPVEYIVGVGKIGEKFVILLDANKALDIDELSRFNKEESITNASM